MKHLPYIVAIVLTALAVLVGVAGLLRRFAGDSEFDQVAGTLWMYAAGSGLMTAALFGSLGLILEEIRSVRKQLAADHHADGAPSRSTTQMARKWRVVGTDRETGVETSIVVTAADKENAVHAAWMKDIENVADVVEC